VASLQKKTLQKIENLFGRMAGTRRELELAKMLIHFGK
jgi:hypothetical protein